MSTIETKVKAAKSLLHLRTFGDRMFPKIFICETKTCPFYHPLIRLMGTGKAIEEMTIHEAFFILYGRKLTTDEMKNVDWNIDQSGSMYDGHLYCPDSDIPKNRQQYGGGRPEIVEFTPMDVDWQEKRDKACRENEDEQMQEVVEAREPSILENAERDMIIDALQQCKWIKTKAAKYLGICTSSLNKRILKYNIIIEKK